MSDDVDRTLFPDIRREDIVLGESLGVGTFGAVFSGLWTLPDGNDRSVALKKVFVLEKEAEILSKIRHKNIIQFYGICKTGSDFFIVTECADNGSLYDHIHSDPTEVSYTFDSIIKWALEIASGIQYLHYDAVDTIIHRDLKSKNVVLDKKFTCKICDFGTSKDLTHSCTAPTWGGTAAWMSPEMILQSEGITTATDVWSYGVVLWEILSREVPYKDYTEFRIFSLITQSGITLAIPDTCPIMLKQLMSSCWKMSPKERVTMRQIHGELSKMAGNQVVMVECKKFLELEDWKAEITKQKQTVENMRKDLEKRRERLENRERALNSRLKLERAAIALAHHPPDDVHQWNEHHTSHWIDNILGRVASGDRKFLDRVNAAVFRNRITGSRLLEITQNDLEHLGVHKLGSRIELMKAVRKLKEDHFTLRNFPTLQQASRMHKISIPNAAPIPTDIQIVILLGMYVRKIGDNCRKVKFYVDSDWADEQSASSKRAFKSAASYVKTVCFSVIDLQSKKPINEPMCSLSTGMTTTPDWIRIEENCAEIKCIANIYFSDEVTQPRNTEISEIVTNIDDCRILSEKIAHLKFRRSSSSSSSLTPGTPNGFHQTTSTPQLRGFWQRKATLGVHGLTEIELSNIQENIRTPSPEIEIVPKGRRRRTVTSGTDLDREHSMSRPRKPVIHGGKDKWNWKEKKARPKFT